MKPPTTQRVTKAKRLSDNLTSLKPLLSSPYKGKRRIFISNFSTEKYERLCSHCNEKTNDVEVTHCPSCNHLLSEPPKVTTVSKDSSALGNSSSKGSSPDPLIKLLEASGWLSVIMGIAIGIAGAVFVTDFLDGLSAFITFILSAVGGISGSLVSFWMARVISNQRDIIDKLRQK